jgi:hypothetical protein
MLDHPWMKASLSKDKKLLAAQGQLQKYVSVRREKS